MKNIICIFQGDLKSVAKNLIIFVVVLGIAILPALYAWFNIASNWDPYSATSGMSFAVCSLDKGYEYDGLKINVGDKLVDGLEGNTQMGWVIVDTEEEATAGVTRGDYYASVVIPEDFSENLLSIVTGKFRQADMHYYVNEKKNAIAPKITDKVVGTLQEKIDSEYVGTLAETIAKVLGVTNNELSKDKEQIADRITNALNDAKDEVKIFANSMDLLVTTLDSIDTLVESGKDLLPAIEQRLAKAGVFTGDVTDTLKATRNTAAQIASTLEDLISSGSVYMTDISARMDDAFGDLSSDAAAAADKLAKIEVVNKRILAVNNRALSILQTIQSDFGIDCSKAISRLEAANDKQNSIIAKIEDACNKIKSTGALPADLKSELEQLVAEAETELTSAESEFDVIEQKIDSAITKSFSSLDDIADYLQSLGSGTNQIPDTFEDASDIVGNLRKVLLGLKDYLLDISEKIGRIVDKVNEIKNDNTIESLVLPIIEDPEALGKFLSSPVGYETEKIYPIENYGSAMTPFYSSLALWVGGVVLVAVLSVDLTKRDRQRLVKEPGSTQQFFGRYLIFFFLGQIQALIIALGDLFFLKVQCQNPLLFILGCLISSFIYTLIIYSLTITFSVIGKALAVIILVLQIAGAGGTFPIEVLPAPFQALSPFLPFKYGVNLLREAVGGVCAEGYLQNLGKLLIFIIPALILGLLLRKPCIKIITFFNKKIEESDLVI